MEPPGGQQGKLNNLKLQLCRKVLWLSYTTSAATDKQNTDGNEEEVSCSSHLALYEVKSCQHLQARRWRHQKAIPEDAGSTLSSCKSRPALWLPCCSPTRQCGACLQVLSRDQFIPKSLLPLTKMKMLQSTSSSAALTPRNRESALWCSLLTKHYGAHGHSPGHGRSPAPLCPQGPAGLGCHPLMPQKASLPHKD